VAQRTPSQRGGAVLQAAADRAAKEGHRLFGFFGVGGTANGHLPFQTADRDYQPAYGRKLTAEKYTPADIKENPTLAEMTAAALTTLSQLPQGKSTGFWLMVESGDVDWANHDNNLDNSIGAVNAGDAAVKVITDWVEAHSSWKESLLIVTADHGHYLVLDKPELLAGEGRK
jgi:alkaline phosphatase